MSVRFKKTVSKNSAFIVAGSAAAVIISLILYVQTYSRPVEIAKGAHIYNKPQLSIRNLDLFVFYAVPKDQTAHDYEEVREKLDTLLKDAAVFHQTQFLGKSLLSYKIYPGALSLKNNSIFYDTDNTSRGNPRALERATLELEARVFEPTGDLYNPNFIGLSAPNAYRMIAIIYEGLGASGTEGSLLLSRDFVTRDEYSLIGSALFYHEFGHAVGLPEGYDIMTNIPFTNDIMGSGRREPLTTNHIDPKSLKAMGVY